MWYMLTFRRLAEMVALRLELVQIEPPGRRFSNDVTYRERLR